MARRCVASGWVLSFAGTVTFKNAQGLRDALAVTPVDQLLVETDAPYLAPVPFRGRPNASYLVPVTVRADGDDPRCTRRGACRGDGPDDVPGVRNLVAEVVPSRLRCRPSGAPGPVPSAADPSPGLPVGSWGAPLRTWRPVSRRLTVALNVALAALLVLAMGGFVRADKTVTLLVDGQPSLVTTHAGDVSALLDEQGLAVDWRDVVAPSPDAPLRDGMEVTVRYARPLGLALDGQPVEVWTTALTVDQALDELGLRVQTASLSASRSAPIPRTGLSVDVDLPDQITFKHDGRRTTLLTTAATVRAAMQEVGYHAEGPGPGRRRPRDHCARRDGRHRDPRGRACPAPPVRDRGQARPAVERQPVRGRREGGARRAQRPRGVGLPGDRRGRRHRPPGSGRALRAASAGQPAGRVRDEGPGLCRAGDAGRRPQLVRPAPSARAGATRAR